MWLMDSAPVRETPKALVNFSPGLRTLSALPWVSAREFRSTLKGLPKKARFDEVRELLQSSMDFQIVRSQGDALGWNLLTPSPLIGPVG